MLLTNAFIISKKKKFNNTIKNHFKVILYQLTT
nr:MAG TPA: hypothetical protein [Ackermannviridae sp.]